MKQLTGLFCSLMLIAALLVGCTENDRLMGSANNGGNVSTSDDGTVNGTNGPDSGLAELMTENTAAATAETTESGTESTAETAAPSAATEPDGTAGRNSARTPGRFF